MVRVSIKYADDLIIVFSVIDTAREDWYYVRNDDPIPSIFDTDLNRQHTSNVDEWLQLRTRQRYSFRTLRDMAGAFREGLEATYSLSDVTERCQETAVAAKEEIFEGEHTHDFASLFWIELIDPAKMPKFLAQLRKKFDRLRESSGDDEFYELLCRLWKFCCLNCPNEVPVVEKFIKRLNRGPKEPSYKYTDTLNKDLITAVFKRVFPRPLPQYKLPEHVRERIDQLYAGRLQRSK